MRRVLQACAAMMALVQGTADCAAVGCPSSSTGPEAAQADDPQQSLQLYLLQTDLHVKQTRLPGLQASGVQSHPATSAAASEDVKLPSPSHRAAAPAQKLPNASDDPTAFFQSDMQVVQRAAVPQPERGGAADAVGVEANGVGDLPTVLTSLVTNIGMVLTCMVIFMVLRHWYPLMYSYNSMCDLAPKPVPQGWFGWLRASLGTSVEEVADSEVGLDQAMLLQFTQLCMKMLAIIGVPLLFVLGPIHCFFGGNAAGEDHLSWLSMGNVAEDSWVYWVHAPVIWGVVLIVERCIYEAQSNFLPLRFKWLRELPNPRATTILVEGIPTSHQSDSQLRAFFANVFNADHVISAHVVKHTGELEAAVTNRAQAQRKLDSAIFLRTKAAHQSPPEPDDPSAVEQYTKEVEELSKQVTYLRSQLRAISDQPSSGVNASTGFVQFRRRADAEFAQSVQYSADALTWVCSTPPPPTSIRWNDLQQSEGSRTALTLLGYLLVAGLIFFYLPIVIWISRLATSVNLGPFQPFWAAFAPTIGLTVMVSFLPTLIISIFHICFNLKDGAWAQRRLQNWYFVFQVLFTILVTAIGDNIESFIGKLLTSPFEVFTLLGSTMPSATHFYMNFLMLQWVTHGMNLTRYVQATKYSIFRTLYEPEDARKLSEPEDQDYYGLGSRNARFTTNACIGIVFSTLSPPIAWLACCNFAVCRLVYGYLIPYAESKKPDLGGSFWVASLEHLYAGCSIYCILMIGVLYGRASTPYPAYIAAPSLVYLTWSYSRFRTAFSWEKLPMEELVSEASMKQKEDCGPYIQPELLDD